MAMEMMSAVRPLETFVPPRAAGQRDVLSLALPPMPLLRTWTDGSDTLVSYS